MKSNFSWISKMIILICVVGFNTTIYGQINFSPSFKCVVLGSGGGIEENNLSAYLLAAKNTNDYVCLDAGTVYTGIEQAVKLGNFYDVYIPNGEEASKTGYVFRELIKGYLISHAHLDHIAGLVIASPASKSAQIYGSPQTIDNLKHNIFNWETWPNFANEGDGINLGVYTYQTLLPNEPQHILNTKFNVTSFTTSHQKPYQSTAFLLENLGDYVLYIGDSGADEIEGTNNLSEIWKAIAPIIREDRLHAIFMECSYPDSQADTKLYGHLSPKWVFEELNNLALITDPENQKTALRGIPVIVTGIKPSWKEGGDNKHLIYKQLLLKNKLGVKIIIPEQGQLIEF